jgi:hypothetical protein
VCVCVCACVCACVCDCVCGWVRGTEVDNVHNFTYTNVNMRYMRVACMPVCTRRSMIAIHLWLCSGSRTDTTHVCPS